MSERRAVAPSSPAQAPGARDAASAPERLPVLFARNLFLPRDLGGNRYPYEVVRRLGERGHPLAVVTPRLHGDFPPLAGVSYYHYAINRRHPLLTHGSNVLSGARLLRAQRARLGAWPVALAGSYDAALALGLASLVPRMPLVFLFHSEFYSEWVQAHGRSRSLLRAAAHRVLRAYMAAVERRVFGLSARIVAVSEFSARQITERAPSTAAKVRVIPTGVDTTYFHPPRDRAEAKRAVGLAPEEMLVLGVGRLVAVKQFDRLVEAFALARRDGLTGTRLLIAGDGPERPRLERLVAELGLAAHVDLRGYCDPLQLRALMQAADLQVCSSAFENFSLAILEGLACGTPVLGTPGGGTPELVGTVDRALVLPDATPASMATAMRRLVGDPPRLRQLGQQARALAAERYDWERVVDQLESVCLEVANPWA